MDITSIELVVGFAVGALSGFGTAVAISRRHMAEIQEEARNTYERLRRDLTVAYSLIEGQAMELFDSATKKTTRSTRK